MTKLFPSLARDRNGAAAVEFAFVTPAFLLVIFGIIEFGSFGSSQQALTEAVHEGARYAVVHGSKSSSPATASSLESLVQNSSSALTPNSVSVTVTFSPNNSPGSTVTIIATYPWSSAVPLLNLPSTTLTAKAVATILN